MNHGAELERLQTLLKSLLAAQVPVMLALAASFSAVKVLPQAALIQTAAVVFLAVLELTTMLVATLIYSLFFGPPRQPSAGA